MALSIFSQNITLTEQGASSLCLPLPPSAIAHMTEAAAADYTFSSDGTAPPSHSFLPTPFPLASTCSKHKAVSCFYPLVSAPHLCRRLFFFPPALDFLASLAYSSLPFFASSLIVHSLHLFAKQLLPVS